MSPRKTSSTQEAELEADEVPVAQDEVEVGPTRADEASEASPAGPLADLSADELADIAGLGYEEARDELARIVAGLEGGQVPLEESMRLWRRGEALAKHCTAWLDGAQRQIETATGATSS